ncbi:TadE/TadG family type IV pilus assembly protein [Pseudoduganella sp.]|uniref:TadE/TadG family type IV pilus assembly protein n=1 Tax=Pseudoduganella sp. TaxID=1880898 RepID=UPI0035B27762
MANERARQRGATLVEFGLALPLLLLLLLALIEYGRLMFLRNAVQEVSRRAARAAALTDFSDAAAMQQLRLRALLRGDQDALPLAPQVGSANIRIDYLWMDAAGNLQPLPLLPACPLANRINCAREAQGASCIRFVRVRLCGSGPGCPPLAYQPLVPGIPVPDSLPLASTLAPAESLGYVPGQAPCP